VSGLRVPDGATGGLTPALGPGDDDPRSPAKVSEAESFAPLGPGDDDPRSPAKGAARELVVDAEGRSYAVDALPTIDPDDEAFDMVAPVPPGPGDPATTPRQLTRVPKRRLT
jgi:hypothetical protein